MVPFAMIRQIFMEKFGDIDPLSLVVKTPITFQVDLPCRWPQRHFPNNKGMLLSVGGPCVSAAATVFHDPLGRNVRLTGSSDSRWAARPVAGATHQLSDRRETPLWRGPTGLSRKHAGAPRRGTCRGIRRGVLPVMTDGRTSGCITCNSHDRI